MTPEELAEHVRNTTDGLHQERAEGKDLLDAAIIAVEKAIYWDRPETCHDGMFETGVKIAILRTNVALAVEMRALRKEMEAFRLGVMMDLRRAREG